MEIYSVENLTFSYPETDINVLNNVSFSVRSGDFITICGFSGSGKSTLLKHLKTCLQPVGRRSGKIYFEGTPIESVDFRTQTQKIGFVMQSPDSQCITDKVWHELAFGLESLSLDTSTIRKRIAEMSSFFGIEKWMNESVEKLSGGQKQILNLASVMVMQPSVLILDEPTSQLDPIASEEFISILHKINTELGTTIIISEHNLETVFSISNRIIVMSDGKIIADELPEKIGKKLYSENNDMFISLPAYSKIFSLSEKENMGSPVTVIQGKVWLEKYTKNINLREIHLKNSTVHTRSPKLELKDVWFRYERNSPDVLKGISIKAYGGEILAILGGNGSGKTTMLSLMSGIKKPYRGKIILDGRNLLKKNNIYNASFAVLPQNPQTLFVKNTVEDDLYEIFDGSNIPREIQIQKVKNVILLCELDKIINRHPYDLSGGEQQKAALAKVLLTEPNIILLDEPTKGLDAVYKIKFAEIIKKLTSSGTCVIMVSHDIEFCAEYADQCAMLFNGEIVSENTPESFFSDNAFYTTTSAKMAKNIIPNAITVNDILYSLNIKNNVPKNTIKNKITDSWSKSENKKKETVKKSENHTTLNRKKLSKRTISAVVMIFLAIPITILTGVYYFGDSKYLFISLIVMLECMLPFFLVFEKRGPQTRELVLIAALSALCISGRTAFYMLPQFKPVTALVIISGVALGEEVGFLVGSVTMLVSNIFFGQGAWTPWQMFAMGIIGFISGIVYRRKILPKNRVSFSIFGFLSVILIYGGIMNPAALIMSQSAIDFQSLAAIYVSGLPMDIIHGLSTAVILFIGAKPILNKLERIKIKYGLID